MGGFQSRKQNNIYKYKIFTFAIVSLDLSGTYTLPNVGDFGPFQPDGYHNKSTQVELVVCREGWTTPLPTPSTFTNSCLRNSYLIKIFIFQLYNFFFLWGWIRRSEIFLKRF